MKAVSLNHSTLSWIYTFSIAILAAGLLSAAATAGLLYWRKRK